MCQGRWNVCLDTTKVMGGPFKILIRSGGNEKVLSNVFVGLMASSCHNNALHSVGSGYSCAAFSYPAKWLSQSLAFWNFDKCARAAIGL